jgi:hypothetical protein
MWGIRIPAVAIAVLLMLVLGSPPRPADADGRFPRQTDIQVAEPSPEVIAGETTTVEVQVDFNWFFVGELRWRPTGELAGVVTPPTIDQTLFLKTRPGGGPIEQPLRSSFGVDSSGLAPVLGDACSASGRVLLEQAYWRWRWNPHLFRWELVQDYAPLDGFDLCVQVREPIVPTTTTPSTTLPTTTSTT